MLNSHRLFLSTVRQIRYFCVLILLSIVVSETSVSAEGACSNPLDGISTINISASNHGKEQSIVAGQFTVTRTKDLSTVVTVPYLLSGSAQNSIDYIELPGSITFEIGESEKTISITPIDDSLIEGDEKVTLILSLGIGYILGNDITDTINLIDNDFETPTLQLSSNSLTFGNQQTNTNSQAQTLTITNSSTVNLIIGKLSSSEDFLIVNDSCSNTSITTQNNCVVDVAFSPTDAENYVGTLTILSNDSTSPSIVNLTGQGRSTAQAGNSGDTGSNLSILAMTGGGSGCGFDSIQWLDATNSLLTPDAPNGMEFVSGFDFIKYEIGACTPSSTLNFTLRYPNQIPVDAKLMQFGPTTDDSTAHWFEIETPVITDNKVDYAITDGQTGDADLSVNGSITGSIGLFVTKPVLAVPAEINIYAGTDVEEIQGLTGLFKLTRVNNVSEQVTVLFTLSGTADNGADYLQVTETISFAVGESEKTISITPIDDSEIEGVETVTITLSEGAGYNLGNHSFDTINLIDNDVQPEVARIHITSTALSFDNQQVRTNSQAQQLTISNASQVDLVIGQLASTDDFQISNDTCSHTTITAGNNCVVNIEFSPDTADLRLGTLVIPSNAISSPSIVNLSGHGRATVHTGNSGNTERNIKTLAFTGGGSGCGFDAIQWLDVENKDLIADAPSGTEFVPGFDFAEYKISDCNPGSTLSFNLIYAEQIPEKAKLMQYGPTEELTTDHWFEIETSVINGNEVTYTITDGLSGDDDVTANGLISGQVGIIVPKRVRVAPPKPAENPDPFIVESKLTVSVEALDFGNQQMNTVSESQQLTVSSAAQANMVIGQLIISDQFQIINDDCSNNTIKAGNSCFVTIVFVPNSTKQIIGSLTIPGNDAANPSIVNLSGQGRVTAQSGNSAHTQTNQNTLAFTGGGSGCGIDAIDWWDATTDLSLPKAPNGTEFIAGFDFVDYQINECVPGSTLTFTLKYAAQIPADAKLMQFGSTAVDNTPHWFEVESSVITGNEVSYTITDGQTGDNDLSVNGSITDPIGLLIPASTQGAPPTQPSTNTNQIRPIPVLSPVGLLVMMLGFAGVARRSFSKR